ncbi:MAG: hypothetical protein U0792_13450 [Gemmataceae bacterium]
MSPHEALFTLSLLLLSAAPAAPAELPKPMATGMVMPESVCLGPNGKLFVSIIGKEAPGDGSIAVIEPGGKPVTFVGGLDDPKGIALYQKFLYVADKDRVYRIDVTAKEPQAVLFAPPNAFPVPPLFLNDVAVDPESGNIFVSDSGTPRAPAGPCIASRRTASSARSSMRRSSRLEHPQRPRDGRCLARPARGLRQRQPLPRQARRQQL